MCLCRHARYRKCGTMCFSYRCKSVCVEPTSSKMWNHTIIFLSVYVPVSTRISYTCKFYVLVVCYSCVAPAFSLECKKNKNLTLISSKSMPSAVPSLCEHHLNRCVGYSYCLLINNNKKKKKKKKKYLLIIPKWGFT